MNLYVQAMRDETISMRPYRISPSIHQHGNTTQCKASSLISATPIFNTNRLSTRIPSRLRLQRSMRTHDRDRFNKSDEVFLSLSRISLDFETDDKVRSLETLRWDSRVDISS